MAEDQNRTLQDKFMLRLPDGMRDRLKDAAAENNRSLNAEIVSRLAESFDPLILDVKQTGDILGPVEQIVERVIRKIREEERREGLNPLPNDPQVD
jgi:hypothetical protein